MTYERLAKLQKDRIHQLKADTVGNSSYKITKQNELLIVQNDEIIRLLTIIANK